MVGIDTGGAFPSSVPAPERGAPQAQAQRAEHRLSVLRNNGYCYERVGQGDEFEDEGEQLHGHVLGAVLEVPEARDAGQEHEQHRNHRLK